jgi:predicted dehydrogenase
MGQAHLRVLAALAPKALAGWAPSNRSHSFIAGLPIHLYSGQLQAALSSFKPTHVVVATPVETLTSVVTVALRNGVKHLLVEKPFALNLAEGRRLAELAHVLGAHISVGYNRRFYCSINTALQMIRQSGEAIESAVFEFNELVVGSAGPIGFASDVRARWLLANSLHVIDAVFFPIGLPDRAASHFLRHGHLDWHPAGSRFFGSGFTGKEVPFSYHANWGGPGRWGFEWITPSTRYIFKPLEKLHIMRRESLQVEEIELSDKLDHDYKPGVFLQDKAFLVGESGSRLASLTDALELLQLGNSIAGYTN